MIRVELAPFSGPMDLLLELLKQAKLDIYDIEISDITERFLEAMQTTDIPPDELSDFIRMASMLVQMKMRMLLKDQSEEEAGISQEEFLRLLVEYRTFKALAEAMRPMEQEGLLHYQKMPEDPDRFRPKTEWVLGGTAGDLTNSLEYLWERRRKNRPQRFHPETVLARDEYPDDIVARRIRDKLAKGRHFHFLDLFDTSDHKKGNLITTFLLLLELSRQNALAIRQESDNHALLIQLQDRERLSTVLQWMEKEEEV